MNTHDEKAKSNWKDIWPPRLVSGTAHVETAQRICAKILGVPIEAIQLLEPSGEAAKPKETLSTLRKDWDA